MSLGNEVVDDTIRLSNKGAVISIDLNNTQKYNDFHGHEIVDNIIKSTAGEIQKLCENYESFLRIKEPSINFCCGADGWRQIYSFDTWMLKQ